MSSFTAQLDYIPVGKDSRGRRLYELTRAVTYRVGSLEDPFFAVTAPVGFRTDLATIPWPFRLVFRPNGRYAPAAVIHDYLLHLYHDNRGTTFSRLVIDAIFYESMLVLGVNRITAGLFYYSVRLYANLSGQR